MRYAPRAPTRSRVYGGRAVDAGAGNRRKHRDLLDRERRDPAAARVSQTRAVDVPDHAVSGARVCRSSGYRRRNTWSFARSTSRLRPSAPTRPAKSNLTAGDRPLRVRSAFVDEHLLNALGMQPAQGRAVRHRRNRRDRPPPGRATASCRADRDSLARVVANRVWRTADRRTDGRSQMAGATKSSASCRPAPTSWTTAPRSGCRSD